MRTLTGEASPSYLFDEQVPQRVAEVLPEAKLIALLRNPVDRTYSHYWHAVRGGEVDLSFEEVIEAELGGEEGNGYIARGIYVDQLERWHRFFEREQLLVLKSEDFFKGLDEVVGRVLVFLGLPQPKVPLTKLVPVEVATRGYYPQQMSPETRERLRDYFEPHNQRLYEYLGTDFGW